MLKLSSMVREWLADRRKRQEPVPTERRGTKRMKAADQKLHDSIDNLERTVRMKREDFFKREIANDSQQVVVFRTFSEICRWRGSDALTVRLCRHTRHEEAANSALARCEENKCPLLLEAIKGAA